MAFENRTIEEIKTLLINAFQHEFNKKIRILPKSFIRIISIVLAGIFITAYKQIGWFFLQLFPETAYWGEVTVLGLKIRPLIKWGVLIGVGPPPKRNTMARANNRIRNGFAYHPFGRGAVKKRFDREDIYNGRCYNS
jgi:hypothetical protein